MLFCTKFAKKSISGLIEKRDHYHWILHIPISVNTKFQPKLTIDLFLDSDSSYNYNRISLVSVQTNYCNNNLLILDVKQLNKIIKLYYLKALWDDLGKIKMLYGMSRVKKHLPGKRSMLMFSPRFAKKKSISGLRLKKWTSPENSAYSNYLMYQISAWADYFHFLDKIFPKSTFSVEDKKKWTVL